MRRLCGDTAACVNMRRPFFILRSTRSFRTARPASSCGSARRARLFRLFPGGHSPFSPSLVVLVPFPSSRRPRAALPGCFPSCRRHSRTASRMMLREHRPFDDQAPTPAARPDATAPPQCRTSARPDSELLQLALQFRGSARLLRQKRTCRLPTAAKMFFRASIALPGAFHRLKRQELSEVTQLFPRRKRLLPCGLRPCHGCAPTL